MERRKSAQHGRTRKLKRRWPRKLKAFGKWMKTRQPGDRESYVEKGKSM